MAETRRAAPRSREAGRPKVLITGATSGIGLELARLFQRKGSRLLLLGRRGLDRLDPALFCPDTYCRTDLRDGQATEQICRFLDDGGIDELDLLIHNAAVGYYGRVDEQAAESIAELVAVNLVAPLKISSALLPRLLRRRGKIVLIGSVASVLPCPRYAVYAATKAGLEGLGRSLRRELKDRVSVQVIHPGATRTEMHAKIGLPREVADWEKFAPACSTAQRIARAIEGNRPSVTLGLGNRLLSSAARRLSRPLDSWLMRRERRCSV